MEAIEGWIDVKKELPPCDGYYYVCNRPENPYDFGMCFYDGLGFTHEGAYRYPDHWKYPIRSEKKYGKQ